jgi:hypothetical protein
MDPLEENSTACHVDSNVSENEIKSEHSVSTPGLLLPHAMRRVDWRWAVAKGFLNKETNEWNEEMGGQEAYLKQRNERMLARSSAFINWLFGSLSMSCTGPLLRVVERCRS